MTSNLGTELLEVSKNEAERRKMIDGVLRQHFRPEFLNRLDDVVLFHSLSEKEIEAIVGLQLVQVEARLKERRIRLSATAAARKLLAREGYDPEFGARPLKRAIQRLVVDPLTVKILGGEIRDGSEVVLDVSGDHLEWKTRSARAEKAAPTAA
jgi:ATP-dependent Clp protease ATP-binding subunit ClpB